MTILGGLVAIWHLLLFLLWGRLFHPDLQAMLAVAKGFVHAVAADINFRILISNWSMLLLDAGCVLGLVAISESMGRRLTEVMSIRRVPAASAAIPALVGSGICGMLAAGLGFAGLLYPPPRVLTNGILILLGSGWLYRHRASGAMLMDLLRQDRLITYLGIIVLIIWSAMIFSSETTWDALTYHLRLPTFYLYRHKIYDVWHNFYSSFPQHADMLFLIALAIRDEIAAKMTVAVFGIGLLLLCSAISRELGVGNRWAAILLFFTPLAFFTSTRAYTDVQLSCYASLSLVAALRFLTRGGTGWFALSGVAMSWALACKYTAVLPFFALLVAASSAMSLRRGISHVLAWTATALAGSAPWLVSNWAFRGNPVHPMLSHLMGRPADMRADAIPFFETSNPLAALLSNWPSRIESLFASPGGVAAPLLPISLGLLPLALLLPASSQPARICRRYVTAYTVFWLVLCPDARFYMPAYPALLALIASLITHQRLNEGERQTVSLLMKAAVVAGAIYTVPLACTAFGPYEIPLGMIAPADKNLRGLDPVPFGGYAAAYVNRTAPRNARILFACNFSSYYFDRECLTDQHLGRALLVRWLADARNPDSLSKRFRQNGVGYVLGSEPGTLSYLEVPGFFDIPEKRWTVWKRFLETSSILEWQTDGHSLHRITRPHPVVRLAYLPVYETLAMRAGDAALGQGNPNSALSNYGAATSLLTNVGSTWTRLGDAHHLQGNLSTAESCYRNALAAGVDTPHLHRALAYLLAQRSQLGEALAHARLARQQNPRSAQTAADLGKIAWFAGMQDEALEGIASAVRLRPDIAEYREQLSQWRSLHPKP